MIGTSILRLIPEHLHSDEKTIIESIRAGRRIEHFETVRLAKDGSLIDVSLTVSPIKDEKGRVIGASKILRDISGRKRIEQSLLQAEKIAATGRMAATIAHEINNPLEAVMNLLYLLRPKIADEEGHQLSGNRRSELGRVSHIAKQTLGYYREHAAASRASLSDIAEHAITIYEPRCTAAGIAIKKSLDSSPKIVLRRGEMMQVISNLIANSIYAMSAGGTLSVSVSDATGPRGWHRPHRRGQRRGNRSRRSAQGLRRLLHHPHHRRHRHRTIHRKAVRRGPRRTRSASKATPTQTPTAQPSASSCHSTPPTSNRFRKRIR